MSGPARKRPQLQFSLLYSDLGFDQLGKPIFVGPYNEMQTSALPVNVLLLISNQWTNGFGLHSQRTELADPDGQVLVASDDVEFFLKDAVSGHRVDHRFGVTLSEPGRYRIHVFVDDERVLEYFFLLRPPRQSPGGNVPEPPA